MELVDFLDVSEDGVSMAPQSLRNVFALQFWDVVDYYVVKGFHIVPFGFNHFVNNVTKGPVMKKPDLVIACFNDLT